MMQEMMDEIEGMAADKVNEIHTAMVGKIMSWDANKCRASIKPYGAYVCTDGDEKERLEYPLLTDVPAVLPGCRSVGIAYPIKKGDDVLIIISENDYDEWLSGTDSDGDMRFDLSNSFFIPGPLNKSNSLLKEACNDNSVVIANGSTKFVVASDVVKVFSKANIAGELKVGGRLYVGGGFEIDGGGSSEDIVMKKNGNYVKVSTDGVEIKGKLTSTGGVSIDASGDSVYISNGSTRVEVTDSSVTVTGKLTANGATEIKTFGETFKVTSGGNEMEISGLGVSITGDVKVNGNIEATGTVKGTNIKEEGS